MLTLTIVYANKIKPIENGYSFDYSFESCLEDDSLLSVLFDMSHLMKYSSQVDDMSIIEKEKNSYTVSFSIKYLFYSSESVFRRTIFPNDNTIVIEMISFTHNSMSIPKMLKSRVEYKVKMNKNGTEVSYSQKCHFEKPVNWFYLKIIEGKLNEAARELQKYIKFLENKKKAGE